MGIVQDAKNEIHTIVSTLKADGHALSARLDAAWQTLLGELPQLAHDAETDAADVVKTAETQGLAAAETEAVTDAGALAAEGASDVATAVETPAPAEPQPAQAPAEPTA